MEAGKHLVLLDKPSGITSHDAVQEVKKIYRAEKAGHCGTLDLKVTGLLVIALNEARKAMPVLMGLNKKYRGIMQLHSYCSESEIKNVFQKFTGTITQTPPVRSRVKRAPRKRKIYSLKILKTDGKEVSFQVICEAGTYIRKLVHDMGEELGCGAHMKSLRRTSVGPFHHWATLEQLKANPSKYLVPLEKALSKIGIKKVIVNREGLEKIRHGAPVEREIIKSEKTKKGENIGIYFNNKIVALGTKTEKGAEPDRLFKDKFLGQHS